MRLQEKLCEVKENLQERKESGRPESSRRRKQKLQEVKNERNNI